MKNASHFLGDLSHSIKTARLQAGLTQVEVANRSGLSHSFIRLVESGKSDISLMRLEKLLNVLNLNMADLTPNPQSEQALQIFPESMWENNKIGLSEGVYFLLMTPGSDKHLETGMFILLPGAKMTEPLIHSGEESLYVIEGVVILDVGGEVRVLRTGDVAYFSSSLPHKMSNASATLPAKVLDTATHPRMHSVHSTENGG